MTRPSKELKELTAYVVSSFFVYHNLVKELMFSFVVIIKKEYGKCR